MSKKNIGARLLSTTLTLLVLAAFIGCVAAIPVIIYKKSKEFHTATVQVNAAPADVYNTAVKLIKDKPDIEIEKQNDEDMKVEINKGEQRGKIMVEAADGGKTELTVKADAGKEAEEGADKSLALRIVKAICDELGVQYTVVEE